MYRWESVLEIYNDARTFGLRSSYSKAVSNSNLAISWLEATFPELVRETEEVESIPAVKAEPYAIFDSSTSLQVFTCSI